MKRCLLFFGAALLALAPAAGHSGPKSGQGLHLPDGNIVQGRATFVALKCNECHQVYGLTLPPPVSTVPTNVVLGGRVSEIRTHGQLVTAIINPSHSLAADLDKALGKDGKTSPMPVLNDRMTVTQLIDVVAFLQSRYELIAPDFRIGGK